MKRYFQIMGELAKKKDLLPKLVCIFLAVILWAYISKTQKSDIKFRIPLTVTGLSTDNVISKISGKYFTVHFRGTSEALKNTNLRNIKLFVDLSKPKFGAYQSYKIEYTREQIPEDVEVDLASKSVRILIEKKVRKKIKVIAVHDENQEGDFVIGKVVTKPEFVAITGTQSHIANIDSIKTEEIDLKGATKTLSKVVNLDKSFKHGESLEVSPSVVSVIIPILPKSMVKKELMNINVTNGIERFTYEVLSPTVEIEYISNEFSLGGPDYRAVVNLSGMGIGKDSKKNEVLKRCEVTLVSDNDPFLKKVLNFKPGFVEVRISRKK